MLPNLPLFEDVLSVEERVLGCMCDSFKLLARTNETIFPVSMNKIDRKKDTTDFTYYLNKNKEFLYTPIVYGIYGFYWCKSNRLNLA